MMKQGRRQWVPLAQAVTDEEGDFRLASLFTTRFQVEVQANRSRALRKQGYPAVVYYPGVYDLASAVPLQLAHGQQVDLQFLIKREAVFKIQGTVAGQEPGENVNVRLRTRSGEDVFLMRATTHEDGAFEITGVPAGSYLLEARNRRGGGPPLFAELPVNVTDNMTGLRLTLRPLAPVPVRVQAESSQPSPEGQPDVAVVARSIRVQLHSLDSPFRDNQSSFETRDGRPVLEVRDLFPGTYSVEIDAWGQWYVQSARAGSVNLLRDPLVVPRGAGADPIELVLRDDGGSITGKVQAEKPERSVVLIVPDFAPMQPPTVLTAGQDGHFAAENLAPGNYRVFAFESLEQLEYSNPLVLRQYDFKAARTSLSAGGSADVTVGLIQVEE